MIDSEFSGLFPVLPGNPIKPVVDMGFPGLRGLASPGRQNSRQWAGRGVTKQNAVGLYKRYAPGSHTLPSNDRQSCAIRAPILGGIFSSAAVLVST